SVFNRPVPPVAVDYLLRPHLLGITATPILNRLVSMFLVRKERGRYYLHPVDMEYAYQTIPAGEAADRDASTTPFTQRGLLRRAAEYFSNSRTPADTWRSLDDMEAPVAEYELYCRAEEWVVAFRVLAEFDIKHLWEKGYYKEIAEFHERLLGKLDIPETRAVNLGHLGYAYNWLGNLSRAVT